MRYHWDPLLKSSPSVSLVSNNWRSCAPITINWWTKKKPTRPIFSIKSPMKTLRKPNTSRVSRILKVPGEAQREPPACGIISSPLGGSKRHSSAIGRDVARRARPRARVWQWLCGGVAWWQSARGMKCNLVKALKHNPPDKRLLQLYGQAMIRRIGARFGDTELVPPIPIYTCARDVHAGKVNLATLERVLSCGSA